MCIVCMCEFVHVQGVQKNYLFPRIFTIFPHLQWAGICCTQNDQLIGVIVHLHVHLHGWSEEKSVPLRILNTGWTMEGRCRWYRQIFFLSVLRVMMMMPPINNEFNNDTFFRNKEWSLRVFKQGIIVTVFMF